MRDILSGCKVSRLLAAGVLHQEGSKPVMEVG